MKTVKVLCGLVCFLILISNVWTIARWSEVFADYEILQPFMQLARDVHAISDDERTSGKVKRFANLEVAGGAVMGLLSRGWTRGLVEDNGIVNELDHALGAMPIAPGIAFGMGGEQPHQTLGAITLAKTAPIDALAFSEMIRTLETLKKK